jgi:hypothetical protein
VNVDTENQSRTTDQIEHNARGEKDPFLVRHQGPNRHQRRKLAKIKDPVARLALLNQIVHRAGLAGNGDRSRLVRR